MTEQQFEHALGVYEEIQRYRMIAQSAINPEVDIKLSIPGITGYVEVPSSLRSIITSYFVEKLAIAEKEFKNL